MVIYGFYHICLINDWSEVVNEQINKLIDSGLYEKSDAIYIGALGSSEEVKNLKDIMQEYPKFIVEYTSPNVEEYELPTINIIHQKSKQEDFYCYYIHAKGVSITEKNMGWYHRSTDFIHLKNCVKDWREYMEYFIIDNHVESLKIIEDFDCCGVNLTTSPSLHFSGNFWWSKSSHLKNLKNTINGDRWTAEMWVCSHPKTKAYGLHENRKAGYLERLSKSYKTLSVK